MQSLADDKNCDVKQSLTISLKRSDGDTVAGFAIANPSGTVFNVNKLAGDGLSKRSSCAEACQRDSWPGTEP